MTNADKIRRMGDTDLTYFISQNFKDLKRCQYCAVGLDGNKRCRDANADCENGIFDFLGQEVENNERK